MKMMTAWCVDKFRNSILFILGLIMSYKLVEKSFFDILITYLNEDWKDLRKSVIVVNFREGTEAVVQILFAYIGDAHTGLFKMVVCSTTIYVIGLSLSCFAARKGDNSLDLGVFYPALLLMTLSHAAQKVMLASFLDDQLVPRDGLATKENDRARARIAFWWNSISFLAAIVALLGLSQIEKLKLLSMVLAIAMGAAFLCFLLGDKFYKYIEPTGSPICDAVPVIHNAIVKRNGEYPEQIPPHVSWLRWLDRAAEQDICTVEQVEGVKCLIKMVPMWTTFLTFSLVVASGSTFFLEEANSINGDAPILLFPILQRLTEFIVSAISDYVLEKLCEKKKKIAQRMMLVRIGVGMIFCPLCCVPAWINALHRFHFIRIHKGEDKDLKEYMSVYRLIPQFLMLGVMEGLCGEGLKIFFDSQVSRSMFRYGPPFGECVLGVGKFLSVVCILILSRRFTWFQKTVNDSRLHKYYAFLVILGIVNIAFYCLVAHWYGDDNFVPRNEVDEEMAISDLLQVDILGKRSLSSKGQKSLSGRIVPIQEESSSGDDLTENTNSGVSEKQQDGRQPSLNPETGQETSESLGNRCNDDEAEKLNPDVIESIDQVSPSDSEPTKISPSDGPMLREATSFSRASSSGIHKRSSSMRKT